MKARLPPEDRDAEMAVIGACLIDGSCLDSVRAIVTEDSFYLPAHITLWRHILAGRDEGISLDLVTMNERLRKADCLDTIPGGSEYLVDLAESCADTANAIHYARIVSDKHHARELIGLAHALIDRAHEATADAKHLTTETAAKLEDIATSHADSSLSRQPMAKILAGIPDAVTKAKEFVPTGWPKFDVNMGGIEFGAMTVLGAYPSVGKTAFAQFLAVRASMSGVPTLFFSLEMAATQLGMRATANFTQTTLTKLRRHMSKSDLEAATGAAALKLGPAILEVVDDKWDINSILAISREFCRDHGRGVIVVDYLQIAQPGGHLDSRNLAVAEMSASLKRLARQTGSALMVLSQLNREPARANRVPTSHDLRDSGAIEQDADVIWMLYRPKEKQDTNGLDWMVEKNRQGPISDYELTFDSARMTFDMPTEAVAPQPAPQSGPLPIATALASDASPETKPGETAKMFPEDRGKLVPF